MFDLNVVLASDSETSLFDALSENESFNDDGFVLVTAFGKNLCVGIADDEESEAFYVQHTSEDRSGYLMSKLSNSDLYGLFLVEPVDADEGSYFDLAECISIPQLFTGTVSQVLSEMKRRLENS